MKAILLTIGDELLIGQVINTNAAWLGEHLTLLGIDVARVETVGDEPAALQAALDRNWASAALLILTGGLGPTHDDLTVEAVAGFFGMPLRLEATVLERIRERYRRRGQPMPQSNRKLALVPDAFSVLPNAAGAAPGLWYDADGRTLVVLPGVPREMKTIFAEEVAPRLRQRTGRRFLVHRTLRTAGIGESSLQDVLGDLSDLLGPDVRLAYLPAAGEVRLRLTAVAADADVAEERADRLEARLRTRAGAHIYGVGDDLLEAVVGRLLAEQGLTVATAESCTGGLLAHRLTNVPGSSAYLLGGIVAYANAAKEHQLGVTAEALAAHGAVSETVARQMAQGVRRRFGADIGLATTGIAGPGGGTPAKPVGTVWIAVADAHGAPAYLYHFGPDRLLNKEQTATTTLDLVRRRLTTTASE